MKVGDDTSVIYVYAIVDRVPESLGLGLDGVPLWAVPGGRLAAVVGEHARAPEVGEDQLWAHEALIERLMKEAGVLPLRFGTTVGGEEELGGWLRTREDELQELLDAVRGAVELGVRAELPSSARPDPGRDDAASAPSGTEYMERRGREAEAMTRSRERFHQPLAELARRAILFGPGPGSSRLRAAYLVDGERVEAFVAEVERRGRELEVEVSCTGPWPPYSFVTEVGR